MGSLLGALGSPIILFSSTSTSTSLQPLLEVPRKGRLYYLLVEDEGLVALARDASEDDDEGDSGAWRINFGSSSAKSRQSAPILQNIKRLSYDKLQG